MQHHPVGQRVQTALEPLLAHEGYDLVWVEFVPHNKVLRLYIDKPQGVGLDDCSAVSRRVGDVLDAEGLMEDSAAAGRYTLEVSSPGLDRPLARPEHFTRFVGRAIDVQLHKQGDARRRYTGTLLQADAAGIRLDADDGEHDFAYIAIGQARLVPQFD